MSSWLVLLIASLLPGSSSQGQPQPQIKVTVKVVNILATVRDKHGQIVSNLGQDDFVLEENRRPRTITYFTKETDLPLTLGLLVDTSESQEHVLGQERIASRRFLEDMLRENDQAFLMRFDREVDRANLTSSREHLANGLASLDGTRPGGTMLYEAVFLAFDETVKKQPGRKALIVLSDGVDHGSRQTLDDAIMAAQRADTVVYSIRFADDMSNPMRFSDAGGVRQRGALGLGGSQEPEQPLDGKQVLERISRETGGRLFEVSKRETIDQIFSTIEEELRNQYSLGYALGPGVARGYHRIHLATKQKDLTVQTRAGYYAER
jgi:VWFA-related protein